MSSTTPYVLAVSSATSGTTHDPASLTASVVFPPLAPELSPDALTQSHSALSSSSEAVGKHALKMVVCENAPVSYRRRMKACPDGWRGRVRGAEAGVRERDRYRRQGDRCVTMIQALGLRGCQSTGRGVGALNDGTWLASQRGRRTVGTLTRPTTISLSSLTIVWYLTL